MALIKDARVVCVVSSRIRRKREEICKAANCDKIARSRDLCEGHYGRLLRTGDLQEDVPLRRKGKGQRFTKAERESWPEDYRGCGTCKAVLPRAAFGSRPSGYLGVDQVCRECRKVKAQADYAKRDYRRIVLDRVRSRANLRGLPFDLDLDDIVIPEFCPVLGVRLERASGNMTDSSPSVDRIKPELGYTKGNIIIISNKANRIKTDATPRELMTVAQFYERFGI